jgi:hypothetical protein
MSRFLAVAVGLLGVTAPLLAQQPAARVAAPAARAAEVHDVSPDHLLSPTAQLYVRWDGIGAHSEAYKKSVWGGVMAGPTGDNIRAVIAKAQKQLRGNLVADPLLEGRPTEELKANLDDLKQTAQLIELIADRGAILAAEVREPTPSLKGVTSVIGGFFGGKQPDAQAFLPEAYVLAVVPDLAEKSESLFAAIRLLARKSKFKVSPLALNGRNGFQIEQNAETMIPLRTAWWVEGKHFVFYAGNMKPEAMVAEITANVAKGGVTKHPLYQRCTAKPGYESVARGFIDTARLVTLAKSLAAPFVPGLAQRLDDLGLGNLKAVVFTSGFDGKESRATYEFDLPGERKGLAKVLKQEPLTLKDLPPMPPDVSRFSALRLDMPAVYDAGVMTLETLLMGQTFDEEDGAKSPADRIRLRREAIAKLYDKEVGANIKDDIVPYLGDKAVVFQSPSEGISVFGTVICVSVKNPAKIRAAANRVQAGLENIIGTPVKVRKKTFGGVEICELYSKNFGVITPTYAVVGDWLVVAFHPQGVQGVILRTKGEIPSWKPDVDTTARLAKLPKDACGLQYCDPRSTAQNLCCIGPLFLGTFELRNRFRETEADYSPVDTGLVPNGHELSKHLFPNLTTTRDDGKTIRIEVNESFSLPGEAIGLEPLVFFALISFLNG